MTTDTNGLYIGRTEKNKIRLTALQGEEKVTFTVEPTVAKTLVAELQSEIAAATQGGD